MRSRFLKFFGSSSLLAAAQLISAVLVARVEGAGEFASFVLAQAIATPFAMFFNLGLRQFFSTDALRYHSAEAALRLKVVAATGALIAGTAAVLLLPSYFTGWAWLFILSLVYKTAEGAVELQVGVLQRQREFHLISRILSAKALLYLVSFLCGELIFGSVYISVAGATLGTLLLIWYSHRVIQPYVIDDPVESITHLFKATLPLGIAALTVSLNINMPRAIVENLGSDTEFVFFVASLQLAAPFVLALNIICQFFLPGLAEIFGNREVTRFRREAMQGACLTTAAALLVGGGYLLFGRDIVAAVYGFRGGVDSSVMHSVAFYIVTILVLGYANYILMSTRSFRFQVASGIGAAFCIVLSWVAAANFLFGIQLVLIVIGVVMLSQATVLIGFSVRRVGHDSRVAGG